MGFPSGPADTRAWLALATAIGCYTAVSILTVGDAGLASPPVTVTVAVAGAIPAGMWAVRVSRRVHATVALGLWGAVFPFTAGQWLAGGPLDWSAGATGFSAALWASTLAAGVTSLYLCCREYGSPADVPAGDGLLDGDFDSR